MGLFETKKPAIFHFQLALFFNSDDLFLGMGQVNFSPLGFNFLILLGLGYGYVDFS